MAERTSARSAISSSGGATSASPHLRQSQPPIARSGIQFDAETIYAAIRIDHQIDSATLAAHLGQMHTPRRSFGIWAIVSLEISASVHQQGTCGSVATAQVH